MEFTKNESKLIVAITLLLVVIPLFYKLGEEPLKRWDESLYATAAYQLAFHGEPLLYWSDFQGQNYNEPVTKPKTLIWMQAVLMKILGYDSKIAIRLPSVLATILLMAFLFSFCYKQFKNIMPGIFTSLVLISIPAYTFHHVARSGDFDSFLLLFSTMGILFFYKFIQNADEPDSGKYLLLTGASFAGAVLFKNVAGLFMLPGLFLYSFYKKKLIELLKNKYLYYAILLFAIIIFPYYLFEYLTFPDYFKELWNHEIGGRFGGVIDRNQHAFYYYFQYIFTTGNHAPWILFLPLSVALAFFTKKPLFREFTIFALIIIFTFLTLISFAETKIRWYVAPVYPMIAILVGFSIFSLFQGLIHNIENSFNRMTLLALFGLCLLFPSYLDALQGINAYKEMKNDCGFHYDVYEECFKKIRTDKPEYKELTVYRDSTDWWIPQLVFYRNVYNDLYNFNIQISEDAKHLDVNQKVVVCYNHMEDVSALYDFDILLKFREIQLIEIRQKKLQ